MTTLVLLGAVLSDAPATVVVEPAGTGVGFWAGGPSVVHDDGWFYLAYRLRRPVDQGRGYATSWPDRPTESTSSRWRRCPRRPSTAPRWSAPR